MEVHRAKYMYIDLHRAPYIELYRETCIDLQIAPYIE